MSGAPPKASVIDPQRISRVRTPLTGTDAAVPGASLGLVDTGFDPVSGLNRGSNVFIEMGEVFFGQRQCPGSAPPSDARRRRHLSAGVGIDQRRYTPREFFRSRRGFGLAGLVVHQPGLRFGLR